MMSEITETTPRLHENSGRKSYKVRQRLPRTDSVYGREEDRHNILESLLRDDIRSENGLSTVPIVGIGGVGKTTLARLVYCDDLVQDHFDLQAWTCVTRHFDVLLVAKSILESIATDQPVDDNDFNLLQGKLKKQLSGKKFLLVLDDVWSNYYSDWNDLRSLLLESCAPGSKVVITTREMEVAVMMATTSTYPLMSLPDEACLHMLAEQSLGTADFSEHQYLMEIGKMLAIRCCGLPSLAKTIGGLLRGKYSLSDWEDAFYSDVWNLSSEDGDGISPKGLYSCTEPILGPSERSSLHIDVRADNNIEDHKAHERRNCTVDLERIFVVTNFILELPSVAFDQLSSVHKPQYALLSMLTSSASLFISIFGLVYKCTWENVTWKWRGALPWLYYPSPSDKLFGNFNDIVGLVCALFQFILSSITYGFVRRHADNPIKVSVWPIIFAFGLLCSNLFKKPEKRNSILAR